MNINKVMVGCSLITSFLALGISATALYHSTKMDSAVNQFAIPEIEYQLEGLSSMISVDNFVFRQAVFTTIDDYVQNKREHSLKAELELYSLAPTISEEHIYGSKNAEVYLYLFLDMRCPYCARLFPQMKKLVDNSGERIALVFRNFPLGTHGETTVKSSLYLECVSLLGGNKKFWLAADQLFKNVPKNDLTELLMLKSNDMEDCINSRETAARVLDSISEGNKLGIKSTPTVVIHDRNNDFRKTIIAPGSADEVKRVIATMKLSRDGGYSLSERSN